LLLISTFPDMAIIVEACSDEDLIIPEIVTVLFSMVVILTLLNMLIGMLAQSINALSAVEKESLRTHLAKEQLLGVLAASGHEASLDFKMSVGEFRSFIVRPEVIRVLHDIHVDPVGLVEFAAYFFGEDADDLEGEAEEFQGLCFDKLIDVVMNLGGSNKATVKDVVDLRRIVLNELEHLHEFLAHAHLKQEGFDRALKEIKGKLQTFHLEVDF